MLLAAPSHTKYTTVYRFRLPIPETKQASGEHYPRSLPNTRVDVRFFNQTAKMMASAHKNFGRLARHSVASHAIRRDVKLLDSTNPTRRTSSLRLSKLPRALRCCLGNSRTHRRLRAADRPRATATRVRGSPPCAGHCCWEASRDGAITTFFSSPFISFLRVGVEDDFTNVFLLHYRLLQQYGSVSQRGIS